ncbi:MAG: hypothetical protein M0Z28_09920 [Rhodospirillales bacterium]|nr:hypothetical protein [Rhodospirillales bacterium]
MAEIVVSEWKPLRKGSLLGFVTVTMRSGLIFREVSVLASHDKVWASPASKPMIDRNGCVMKNAAGKIRYSPIVSFVDATIRERWSAAVVAAVRAAYPEAFSDV